MSKKKMSTVESFTEDVMRYFEVHGVRSELLNLITSKIRKYTNKEDQSKINFCIPKFYTLTIDMTLLADISVLLAQFVIDNPRAAEQIFVDTLKYAVKDIILAEVEIPSSFSVSNATSRDVELDLFSQMCVSFKLKGIPSFHLFSLQPTNNIRSSHLIVLRGTIVSITPILKYKRIGVYACSSNNCSESQKKLVKTSLSHVQNSCWLCSSSLIEKTDERDLGDIVKAIFIPKPIEFSKSEITRSILNCHRGMPITLQDSLVSSAKLGEVCDVAGYMGSQGLYAYYVNKSSSNAIMNHFSLSKISRIMNVKEKTKSSPWAFFIVLASQFCSNIYPRFSFLNLKRGLLLSLASVQNASSCPIPVLAVGREALPAHRLMLHASTLAFRNVLHSIQQPITGKTRYQDEDKDGSSIWFDAGSLILAQGGICYLGEWGRHKQKTASEVLSVIEKKQITLTSDRKVSAASLSFPLQSAIWTYSNVKKKEKLLPLLSVFGIPFIADIDSEAEDEATKIILQNSRKSVKQEKSDPWDAELKMFLQISANNKVTLDPESVQLIQDYFVASRRCRKMSNPEECLPVGAIDILTQMSEAHARISMRSKVIREDALAAICLCEEALSALHGNSFMSAPPSLRLKESNWSNLVMEVDHYMQLFDCWVQRFLNDLIGEKPNKMAWEE